MSTAYFPKSKVEEVLRINNRCIRCGREAIGPRGKAWSIDHFIPFAIAKWAPLDNSELVTDDLIEELNVVENAVIMCISCNFDKGARVIAPHEVHDFKYMTPAQVKTHDRTYKKHKSVIHSYKRVLKELLNAQRKRCYLCDKFLPVEFAAIRRIDSSKDRAKDNACVVCNNCSRYIAHRRHDEVLRKGMLRNKMLYSILHNV